MKFRNKRMIYTLITIACGFVGILFMFNEDESRFIAMPFVVVASIGMIWILKNMPTLDDLGNELADELDKKGILDDDPEKEKLR